MNKQYLDVFYFIKNTQKSSVLRVTHSEGKMYFYAQVTNPTCDRFVRISKYEFDQIQNHFSVVKDCFISYFKGSKLYQEHCIRFKDSNNAQD